MGYKVQRTDLRSLQGKLLLASSLWLSRVSGRSGDVHGRLTTFMPASKGRS